MSRLHLTLACGSYDVNRGLVDSVVVPDGIDLTVLRYPSPERHWRMGRHDEFDVCEFSLSDYIMLHDRAKEWIGVPAFPLRRFRHNSIYVNASAGINRAKDLEGRRVGLQTWGATVGLWVRGILQDQYDVNLSSITWVGQHEEVVPVDLPGKFKLGYVGHGQSVTSMLETGELDALIYPETPNAIVQGDPRVRRLFSDPKAEEIGYYRATGFFPIMHTVVVKKSAVEANPWVPRNLLLAFRASKDLAFRQAMDPRRIPLAWVSDLIVEQRAILGTDPWAYSFADNRKLIRQMIRWAHEQGMIGHMFEPEELFAPETRDDLPTYV